MERIGKRTLYTFEVTDLERLMLMGLLSSTVNKEEIKLDADCEKIFNNILKALRESR